MSNEDPSQEPYYEAQPAPQPQYRQAPHEYVQQGNYNQPPPSYNPQYTNQAPPAGNYSSGQKSPPDKKDVKKDV